MLRKINRQVLLKFCILTVLNYLDRTNLAFAAPRMNKDLHFSGTCTALCKNSMITPLAYRLHIRQRRIYFFCGLCTLPGSQQPHPPAPRRPCVALHHAGRLGHCSHRIRRHAAPSRVLCVAVFARLGRVWHIPRHVVSSVAVLRLDTHGRGLRNDCCGCGALASAGRANRCWYGIVISSIHGASPPTVLLSMDGLFGIAGWRWLFIMEGVPTVLFGLYMYRTLADGPCSDGLLTLEEQGWLLQRCDGCLLGESLGTVYNKNGDTHNTIKKG